MELITREWLLCEIASELAKRFPEPLAYKAKGRKGLVWLDLYGDITIAKKGDVITRYVLPAAEAIATRLKQNKAKSMVKLGPTRDAMVACQSVKRGVALRMRQRFDRHTDRVVNRVEAAWA